MQDHAGRHRGEQSAAIHNADSSLHDNLDRYQFHLPHRLLRPDDVVPGTVQSFRRVPSRPAGRGGLDMPGHRLRR